MFIKNEKFVGWNTGLNPDGSEVIDPTVMVVPLDMLKHPSADMKLKQMLDRELERRNRPDETNLDSVDFDIESDEVTLHPLVKTDFYTKQEVLDAEKQRRKKAWLAKQTDGKDSAVRKSAQTDRAKRVEGDTSTKSKKPASEAPTEGAGSQDEE